MMGAEYAARKWKSDSLKEIKEYLYGINKDKKIIIAGDINQEIFGYDIEKIYHEIGVQDPL